MIDPANDDSFEIHYDEKRGRLELACTPQSYNKFRNFVSKELADFGEIDLDRVREIEILDAHSITAGAPSPLRSAGCIAVVIVVIVVCTLVVIGGLTIAHWFTR